MSYSIKTSLKERIRLTGKIFRLFGKAIQIREFRKLHLLTLPSINRQITLTERETSQMCNWIINLSNLLCFWRFGKCFYRSFITASILRQFGVPLMLNIGVKDPFSNNRTRGHCWLTQNGELIHEPRSTLDRYTVYLGELKGQIIYWTSQAQSKPVSRNLKKK